MKSESGKKKVDLKAIDDILELSSSEDELPDLANMFTKKASSPKVQVKKNIIISDDEDGNVSHSRERENTNIADRLAGRSRYCYRTRQEETGG